MSCISCGLTWAVIILSSLYFIFKLAMKKYQYFKEKGIPHVPGVPIFGSLYSTMMMHKSIPDWLLEVMHQFRTHRFFGIYGVMGPTFVLQDPDLIKQICVKDFDNFTNHPNMLSTSHDELLSNALNILRDQKWKDMRSTLSPAFTGSKMRMMFDLIRECADDFVSYCNSKVNSDKTMEIVTKDIFSKVTINIISSTAFGLKVDSVRDPQNPVFVHATRSFDIRSLKAQIKFLMIGGMPKLADFLGVSFTPKDSQKFFKKLVKDTIEHRRKTKETRPDVIQLLIQAQDGTLKYETEEKDDHGGFAVIEESDIGKKEVKQTWSDTDLAAQCFLFFVAGFDTTSTLLTFASYELAVNDEVQEKLFAEIKETKQKLMGRPINYELLQKMEYLDAFVSEVLRVHPPGFLTDRYCNNDTEIEDHEGKKFTIPKGSMIWSNIYGIHHSHKYFPNPEKFDPERFLGANKEKIIPNSYIPFGLGPRACIGSRFALMEGKIILYSILSEFKFEVCDKTLVPMRYSGGFGMGPRVDLIVQLKKR
ncbi:probable cytochrome P450 9f2 [Culicoides brevitarsis]|uniref:probable cytochrome P450 9f2 n=1 Tax=Culicoides brevitarsis TaxID=469753 RepID=UPI00307C8892